MDITNAELQMPQPMLPATEPAQENEALTREGVQEAKEAGKHEQKNYESDHADISRKNSQSVSVELSKPQQKKEPDKAEAAQEQPKAQPEFQTFDQKGRVTGHQDSQRVDVVL